MQSQESKGIVVQSTGNWYNVKTTDRNYIQCKLKGNFRIKGIKTTNPLTIGDKVWFTVKESHTGLIYKIEPRDNYIIRKSTRQSSQAHILAANLDQALIVATLSYPRTSTGFIDRFLVSAEGYHIPAKSIFNKSDLQDDKESKKTDELMEVYESIGYETMLTSAIEGNNLDKLKKLLEGKLTAIVGHSGVGKSKLLNALVPGLNLKIGKVSETHLKGKHTTAFAGMHELWNDTWVVDTPGIKEFGLIDIEKDELRLYFPEMMKYAPECRFYNCTHEHEPDCAVKDALEKGLIPEFRYKNYLNMLQGEEMKSKY